MTVMRPLETAVVLVALLFSILFAVVIWHSAEGSSDPAPAAERLHDPSGS